MMTTKTTLTTPTPNSSTTKKTTRTNAVRRSSARVTRMPTHEGHSTPRSTLCLGIALFTLALCAGATATEAAVIANFAAGVVVGKLGTATLTPAELLGSFETEA